MLTETGFSQIQKMLLEEEGFRPFPYIDTTNNLTIGIGWNLKSMPMTKAQALYILDDHINDVDLQLTAKLPYYGSLDEVRKTVLVDMAFNMGVANLLNFQKMLAYIEQKNYVQAAQEMLKSKWAQQVPNRAKKLTNIMRSGQWP